MSFRTERSVVKNLGYIHVNVTEILRFALVDNNIAYYGTLINEEPRCN